MHSFVRKRREKMSSNRPHAILVPFPVQGHINPMLYLAHNLSSHGFIVTFVTTDFNHSRTVNGYNNSFRNADKGNGSIHFRAISDGLEEDDGRTDFARLARVTETAMPTFLRRLIEEINDEEVEKVTFMVADFFASWALDVANQFMLQTAAFWPGLIAVYAIIYGMPDLISRGIIPPNGIPNKHELVKYFPCMPSLSSANLPWLIGTRADREFRFQFWLRSISRFRQLRWVLCNSFNVLEHSIIATFPKEAGICPIGPLLPNNNNNKKREEKEKDGCLQWLDKQSFGSVIYVSFGSSIVLKEKQVEEVASALESSGRPYLWVVRGIEKFVSGSGEHWERNGEGKKYVVAWAPQRRVLAHRSVGCFVTHCGWNSTVESITAGVPMICWPCVADQFLNSTYVVDVWKIGLGLNANEEGIVEKVEIEERVGRIMGTGEEAAEIRRRAQKLKECAVNATAGSSSINFTAFLNAMKMSARG